MLNLKCFILLAVASRAQCIIAVEVNNTKNGFMDSSSFYTAGVVEFHRSDSLKLNARQRLENNLNDYLAIISSAQARPTDILVFPESTLNSKDEPTFVPDPARGAVVPCQLAKGPYHEFLRALSCQARNTSKYVVINLTEQEICPSPEGPTAEEDKPRTCLNIYNTNVVFDREGRVISRYRKQHLYGEAINTTSSLELGIFDTDFGVRFGHFICFDILFYAPAQEMVQALGIKDFVFTSMWFGQLPFLTGVQFQSAWAYANEVNLLAAGASNPVTGSTGSGIYHGRQQPLVAVMNRQRAVRRLYVAQVPKFAAAQVNARAKRHTVTSIPRQTPTPSDIHLKRDSLHNYLTELVNISRSQQSLHRRRLCYSDAFCCNFELSWRRPPRNRPSTARRSAGRQYSYRLGIFEGWRNERSHERNYIRNCAVFACTGADMADCGRLLSAEERLRVSEDVVFERILIETHLPKASHYLVMPNSLLADSLLPLPVNHFQWNVTDQGSMQQVRFLLNSTVADLLTFSIYGNYFDGLLDDSNSTTDNAMASTPLVVLSAIIIMLWNLEASGIYKSVK